MGLGGTIGGDTLGGAAGGGRIPVDPIAITGGGGVIGVTDAVPKCPNGGCGGP